MMAVVALEELYYVREDNPDDVMLSFLKLRFTNYTFITECLYFKLGLWRLKMCLFTTQG